MAYCEDLRRYPTAKICVNALQRRSVLLPRFAEPVPIVYIPSYTLMQMPGQSLYETMIPMKLPGDVSVSQPIHLGCVILHTISILRNDYANPWGRQCLPAHSCWMRDTTYQLHHQNIKSM